MSYLHSLCLFMYSGVQHILCCVFAVFLRLVKVVYPVDIASFSGSTLHAKNLIVK